MNSAQIIGGVVQLSQPRFELTVRCQSSKYYIPLLTHCLAMGNILDLRRLADPVPSLFSLPTPLACRCSPWWLHHPLWRDCLGSNIPRTVSQERHLICFHGVHQFVGIYQFGLGRHHELLYPSVRTIWNRWHHAHSGGNARRGEERSGEILPTYCLPSIAAGFNSYDLQRAMIWSIIFSGVTSLLGALVMGFCIGDWEAYLETEYVLLSSG